MGPDYALSWPSYIPSSRKYLYFNGQVTSCVGRIPLGFLTDLRKGCSMLVVQPKGYEARHSRKAIQLSYKAYLQPTVLKESRRTGRRRVC